MGYTEDLLSAGECVCPGPHIRSVGSVGRDAAHRRGAAGPVSVARGPARRGTGAGRVLRRIVEVRMAAVPRHGSELRPANPPPRDHAGPPAPLGRVGRPSPESASDRGEARISRGSPPGDAELRVVLDLFERHYELVFRFARRSVDEATAEDITQEVFARLLRLDDLATREIRSAYLLKIAANLIKRRYQRERRFGEVARRASGRHAESATPERPAPQLADDRADRGAAAHALQRLSSRERDAVDLIVCRGLSYREAAASMGVKVSDVNNWRYRGVERLRRDGTGDA